MFTFQNMTSKRRREDDSDSEDGGGYGYSGQQPKVRIRQELRMLPILTTCTEITHLVQ